MAPTALRISHTQCPAVTNALLGCKFAKRASTVPAGSQVTLSELQGELSQHPVPFQGQTKLQNIYKENPRLDGPPFRPGPSRSRVFPAT